jgi:hypothetical protein
MAKNAKKAPKKKTATTTAKPALIKRPNGRGALYAGGVPGNRGGGGCPPSQLRELLRGSIAQRSVILEQIMDGKPLQKATFTVKQLSGYLVCANCGEGKIKPTHATTGAVEIEVEVAASPRDRIAAWDTAAKYGLGALKEVSVENVRERLLSTLAIIRKQLPQEKAEAIIAHLRDVWA